MSQIWSNWIYVAQSTASSSDVVRLIGDGKCTFSIYDSSNASAKSITVNDDNSITLSVTCVTTNGAAASIRMISDAYVDLTNYNELIGIVSWTHSSSYTGTCYLTLLDEDGVEHAIGNQGLSSVNGKLGVHWDISEYSGKYKIIFKNDTWSFTTGYPTEYTNTTYHNLFLA